MGNHLQLDERYSNHCRNVCSVSLSVCTVYVSSNKSTKVEECSPV